jgi:hypothetical protein
MPAEVAAAHAAIPDVTDGLISFQLQPKHLKGLDLFDHMCKKARRSIPVGQKLLPSAALNLEFSDTQATKILNPTQQDFMMGSIMATAHGEGAKQHMAKRKLDSLGCMVGQSGFRNDPGRVKKLKDQLRLCKSMAEINQLNADEHATKKSVENSKLLEMAPQALDKLKSKVGGDLAKLTMPEMKAIALKSFRGVVLAGDKSAHVIALSKLITQQPAVLQLATTTASAPTITVGVATPSAVAPTITIGVAAPAAIAPTAALNVIAPALFLAAPTAALNVVAPALLLAAPAAAAAAPTAAAPAATVTTAAAPAAVALVLAAPSVAALATEGESDGENEYVIDSIVAQRKGQRGRIEYLTTWKGYDDQTWQSAASLSGTTVLKEWKASMPS